MRSKKKDREIGETVSSFGFAFEVFKQIAHAVTALGGTMKDLQRIIKEPELQQKIAELIVASAKTFVATVVYIQPEDEGFEDRCSSHNERTRLFGYKRVQRFYPIERCKDVSLESREVVFEYVYIPLAISTEGVLTEMGVRNLRPALYEELLGFAERHPDEQLRYDIVALGSEISERGNCYFAVLSYSTFPSGSDKPDSRTLCLKRTDGIWHADERLRFLAVRE